MSLMKVVIIRIKAPKHLSTFTYDKYTTSAIDVLPWWCETVGRGLGSTSGQRGLGGDSDYGPP
jgi:hypothetical protein